MEMANLEVDLTADEIKTFNEYCAKRGICPSQKIGELVHGFILSEGVKHKQQSA